MKQFDLQMPVSRISPRTTPSRILLCKVVNVDLVPGFGDLTVRCLARDDGHVEVVDLMFPAIDVAILASAISICSLAASSPDRSSNCDSTASLDQVSCRPAHPKSIGSP